MLATPFPDTDLELFEPYSPSQHVSADEISSENQLPPPSVNHGDGDRVASSYVADDSPVDDPGFNIFPPNWWMSPEDRVFTEFPCKDEGSICCMGYIIGRLTRSITCLNSAQIVLPIFCIW